MHIRMYLKALAASLAMVVAVAMGGQPAAAASDLTPSTFVPFKYEPVAGVNFTVQLPTAVSAPDACANLPIMFQHSNVTAANALSASVELWNQSGQKLTSKTIFRSGGWNPTGGATRMDLFDCDWAPGDYSLILWASYDSYTLFKQTTVTLRVTRPAPAVTSVSPPSGPAAGGTGVTLKGSGFAGATSVTFGGVPGSGISVVGDDTIYVQTPAHAAGPVDVTVTAPGGSGTAAGAFTFVAPDRTALSLKVSPKKVKKGKKAKLSGVLSIPDKGLIIRGASVGLWVSAGGKYKSIGSATTDGSGFFAKRVKIKKQSTFKATYGGASQYAPSESRAARAKLK